MSIWGRVCLTGGGVFLLGTLLGFLCPAGAEPLSNTGTMRISLVIPARAEAPSALRVAGGVTSPFDLCLRTPAGYRVRLAATNAGVLVRPDGVRQRPGEVGDVRTGASCANGPAYTLEFAGSAPTFSTADTFVIIPQ